MHAALIFFNQGIGKKKTQEGKAIYFFEKKKKSKLV